MILNNNQIESIKKRISNSLNDNDLSLPNEIETDRVYNSIYYKYINRGCRDLRFKVSLNENEDLIIEYYFVTDDYSSHKRINADGTDEELENFEGQFGWPVYDNDDETRNEHQRIREHNNRVHSILKEKGFEK
jgi:hypothetical protein